MSQSTRSIRTPEVTAFQENDDGTVTLTVHAVFPYLGSSRALVHEVTVRPMENAAAAVRYVSNKIISSLDDPDDNWYVPRLSREERSLLYEENTD